MLENYLLKGLFIGVVFGVPAGVVGMLAIQRAFAHGPAAGFVTGMGSSAADVLYAMVGVFGVTLISDFLLRFEIIIGLMGGLLVIVMGARTFTQAETGTVKAGGRQHSAAFFLSSFLIAVSNPAAILSFMLVFSMLGVGGGESLRDNIQLVCGIFGGTCFWWLLIAAAAYRFRALLTKSNQQKLNKVFGTGMILFGVVVGGRCLLACFP